MQISGQQIHTNILNKNQIKMNSNINKRKKIVNLKLLKYQGQYQMMNFVHHKQHNNTFNLIRLLTSNHRSFHNSTDELDNTRNFNCKEYFLAFNTLTSDGMSFVF